MAQRRFKTDYAGIFPGFCKTRESAVVAAVRHIMYDGYSRATITDLHTGEDIARVTINSDQCSVTISTATQVRKVAKK